MSIIKHRLAGIHPMKDPLLPQLYRACCHTVVGRARVLVSLWVATPHLINQYHERWPSQSRFSAAPACE